MRQVRKNLAYLIEKRETNPTQLAKATGVPQPTILRILTGESEDPRTNTLQPLADYFGCTVEFLRTADAEGADLAFEQVLRDGPQEVEAAPNLRPFKHVPPYSFISESV